MSTEADKIHTLVIEVAEMTAKNHPGQSAERVSITAVIVVFADLFEKMDSRIKELEWKTRNMY